MELTLTAAGKLIMMLLCLCGMPQGEETLFIDVIAEGIVETIVAKPTADGFALFEKDGGEKLMDIRRDGSAPSFVVAENTRKIDLTEIFPSSDFKDFSTASKVDLKAVERGNIKGGIFKVTRSSGTAYVTGPAGVTLSIHK